jgi:hypothetical protein
MVVNDSGRAYRALTHHGISATRGGPSGIGEYIDDGTVIWKHVSSSPRCDKPEPHGIEYVDGECVWCLKEERDRLRAAKRMRFKLDDLSELQQMRELQALLLSGGYDIDLHSLYRAWSEMSHSSYCAQWMSGVGYESIQNHPVLEYLEADT